MRIEALKSMEAIAQPMSDESYQCSRSVSFIDQFCSLKKALPKIQREYLLSVGFSGALLLIGGLSEQLFMMEVGGFSFCLAVNYRKRYLDAKKEFIYLQKEIKSRRIVFWGEHQTGNW